MPRNPTKRKLSKAEIKAAADRAEARSKGETPKPKVSTSPLDPPEVRHDPVTVDGSKMGRPTKYKTEFVSVAEAMCKLGATDADLADAFDCDIRTVQRWRVQHEDFCRATEIGKDYADNAVERSLYQRANGYTHDAVKIMTVNGEVHREGYREHFPPDTAAAIYWLNNRKPDKWRQVSRTEHTGAGGGPIVTVTDESKLQLARWIAYQLTQAPDPKQIEG